MYEYTNTILKLFKVSVSQVSQNTEDDIKTGKFINSSIVTMIYFFAVFSRFQCIKIEESRISYTLLYVHVIASTKNNGTYQQ